MINLRAYAAVLFLFTFWSVSSGQSTSPASPAGSAATSTAIHFLAPKPGARLNNDFVRVQYEMANTAVASGSPTYRLCLDARDPVDTTDTSYTFTGLTPGAHAVSIMVVDANGTPMPGSQNEIRFLVGHPAATTPSSALPKTPPEAGFTLVPRAVAATASVATEATDPTDIVKPLIFLLCGVIIGGIISAARTRSAGNASK